MSKTLKTSLLFVFSGVGIYLAGSLLVAKEPQVPEEFSKARTEGANAALRIVAASTYSLTVLEQIAKLDQEGESTGALLLASNELGKMRDFRAAALELSSELGRMAQFLNDIEPERARVLATEAVTAEVALVSRLLTYGESLTELFKTLVLKFEGTATDPNGNVEEFIKEINTEAKAINQFNNRFTQALAEFDKIVGGK